MAWSSFVFIFLFFSSSLCLAQGNTYRGYFFKPFKNSPPILRIDTIDLTLSPATAHVKDILARMEHGDRLQLRAEPQGRGLVVYDVIFVGLRRLVGLWMGDITAVNFTTFEDFAFFNLPTRNQVLSPLRFQYSLSPSNGEEWLMIYSNESTGKTELATIIVEKAKITVDYIINENTAQRVHYNRVF